MCEQEEIVPASTPIAPSQMSPEQFREMLLTLYEENGLLADLRSYLRLQMIRRLRNTPIGRIQSAKSNFSLPRQAFNLIVAEYLLREGCHYTLSVFSTEVPPIANQLPFSLFEIYRFQENENWRFDEDSINNLLELIGISKGSEDSLKINAAYLRSSVSLLSCIIQAKKVLVAPATFQSDNNFSGNVIEYLNQTLGAVGVPLQLIKDLEERFLRSIFEETRKLGEAHTGRFDDLQIEIGRRDEKIQELKQARRELKHDLRKVQSELSLAKKTDEIKENLDEPQTININACNVKHCDETCQTNLQLIVSLRKELDDVHALNTDRSKETERLRDEIANLNKDLVNSRAKIEFLNKYLAQTTQINLGEEVIEFSEESSEHLTEEILQQVRVKLHQLEKESDELDSRFRRLKFQ